MPPSRSGTASNLAFPRTDTQWNRFLRSRKRTTSAPRKLMNFVSATVVFLFANIPTDLITLQDVGAQRGNSDLFPGIYQFAVSGLFTVGTGVNDDRGTVSNTFNHGRYFFLDQEQAHMRFGGEAVQYQLNRFNNFAVRGSLTTAATTGAGNAFTAFQNFLQGRVTAIQSAFGDPARNFIATDYSGFFQDDYRWSQRLTFNIGLRWEGMSFGHDKLYGPRFSVLS